MDDKYIYRYIVFDEIKKQYVLDEEYHFSHNYQNKKFIDLDYLSYYSSYVADNMMYLVSTRLSDEDLETKKKLEEANDDSIEFFKPNKRIILVTKLNLDTNTVEEVIPISEELNCNDKNSILPPGSQPFPSFNYDNIIYIFTVHNFLYKYDCNDGSVEKIEMKYDFKDTISKYLSNNKKENTQFGSIYKVEEDGNIYIGNAYTDGKLRIHKLNDDGIFELYWESKETLPDMQKRDMGINTFEIIN